MTDEENTRLSHFLTKRIMDLSTEELEEYSRLLELEMSELRSEMKERD